MLKIKNRYGWILYSHIEFIDYLHIIHILSQIIFLRQSKLVKL